MAGNAMHELRELDAGRRPDPAEPCPVGAIHANTIQRTTEALDECDLTVVWVCPVFLIRCVAITR